MQAAQESTQHLNIGNFIYCIWMYAHYKWNVKYNSDCTIQIQWKYYTYSLRMSKITRLKHVTDFDIFLQVLWKRSNQSDKSESRHVFDNWLTSAAIWMGFRSVHTLVGENHIITSCSRLGISSAELLVSFSRYVVFVSQGYSSMSRGQTWEQSQTG